MFAESKIDREVLRKDVQDLQTLCIDVKFNLTINTKQKKRQNEDQDQELRNQYFHTNFSHRESTEPEHGFLQ